MERICKEDVEKLLKIIVADTDLCTKIRIHFEDVLDDDYQPPICQRRESYSEDSGSAEEEECEYGITDEGHYYLK
tara:strand:- start:380 stop:604 length:225 start_codon:yes stop_codon:yes gene_type:complete